MMSVVAILTNIELFSYIGRTECEDDVKAIRHDMAGALLDLLSRGGFVVHKSNEWMIQQPENHYVQYFPWGVFFYL